MKNYITLVLSLFILNLSFAQLENSHWYFGKKMGLDFNKLDNNGYPTEDLNGNMNSEEGCASISDKEGNLLFYTNGLVVYNKDHSEMKNGRNLIGTISGNQVGQTSSTQAAVIVPNTKNKKKFYIFSVDSVTKNKTNRGIHYSVVDMNLDDEKGDITEKNIPLPLNGVQHAFEKIAVVKNEKNRSYWVVTFYLDSFYAFQVNNEGVNHNPVISKVSTGFKENNSDGKGYMKISPDGTKIVNALEKLASNTEIGKGCLILYDFNVETAKVSNEKILAKKTEYYGVEFSPDSNILYANNYNEKTIEQYDLTSSNIIDSKHIIEINSSERRMPLQLGSDNRIYIINNSNNIAVINNPNNYKTGFGLYEKAIKSSRKMVHGLPPLVFLYPYDKAEIKNPKTYCSNSEVIFTIETNIENYIADWYIDEEFIEINKELKYTFRSAKSYKIKALVYPKNNNNETSKVIATSEILINPSPKLIIQFQP